MKLRLREEKIPTLGHTASNWQEQTQEPRSRLLNQRTLYNTTLICLLLCKNHLKPQWLMTTAIILLHLMVPVGQELGKGSAGQPGLRVPPKAAVRE